MLLSTADRHGRRLSRRKRCTPAFQAPPTVFECRWAEGPIVIDGKADEAAWKNAMAIDRFYLPWLGKNVRAARTATKAKLLWDRDYLYFFAEMEDHDIYADVTEQDGMTWSNDVFELFFKPAQEKPGYYEFQVNAAGTGMELYLPRAQRGRLSAASTKTTAISTSTPRSSCAARSTTGPTRTKAGRSRDASPGRTS